MIKEGVVKKDKTPCPITGKLCNCDQSKGECEAEQNKSASLKEIGDILNEGSNLD